MIYSSQDIEQKKLKLVILGQLLLFIPQKTPKIKILENEKICWRYISSFYRCALWDTEWDRQKIFVILGHFLPVYLFEKIKKTPRDMILYMCTINDNHMMYGSWNMEHDRQNFSSFWTIFCTFMPLTTRKIKTLKKCKHHLEILSLYTCVP